MALAAARLAILMTPPPPPPPSPTQEEKSKSQCEARNRSRRRMNFWRKGKPRKEKPILHFFYLRAAKIADRSWNGNELLFWFLFGILRPSLNLFIKSAVPIRSHQNLYSSTDVYECASFLFLQLRYFIISASAFTKGNEERSCFSQPQKLNICMWTEKRGFSLLFFRFLQTTTVSHFVFPPTFSSRPSPHDTSEEGINFEEEKGEEEESGKVG